MASYPDTDHSEVSMSVYFPLRPVLYPWMPRRQGTGPGRAVGRAFLSLTLTYWRSTTTIKLARMNDDVAHRS